MQALTKQLEAVLRVCEETAMHTYLGLILHAMDSFASFCPSRFLSCSLQQALSRFLSRVPYLMAEALAVVGIVSSVIQLVDFGTKVLERLIDFESNAQDMPKAYKNIRTELPLLIDTLNRARAQSEDRSLAEATQKALLPVIRGCQEQIGLLSDTLEKTLPVAEDTTWTRGRKALASVRYEKRMTTIMATLRNYVSTLTYHQATSSARRDAPPKYSSVLQIVEGTIKRDDCEEDVGYHLVPDGFTVQSRYNRVLAVARPSGAIDCVVVSPTGNICATRITGEGSTVDQKWTVFQHLHVPDISSLTAIEGPSDHVDLYMTGSDCRLYTTTWEPRSNTLSKWEHCGAVTDPGTPVALVNHSGGDTRAFITGSGPNHDVWTAWREREGDYYEGLQDWEAVQQSPMPAGTEIAALPCLEEQDRASAVLMVTNAKGKICAGTWLHGSSGSNSAFGKWRWIGVGTTAPGSPVTLCKWSAEEAVAFVAGADQRVFYAVLSLGDERTFNAASWSPVGNRAVPAGAKVGAVSHAAGRVDAFVTGTNSRLYHASWDRQKKKEPFEGGWRPVGGGLAPVGTPVTAVSRTTGSIDLFIVGMDPRVWTSGWREGDAEFSSWTPVGDLVARAYTT